MNYQDNHTNARKEFFPALTGVRFFLALWVVAFHSCEELRDYPLLFTIFSKGYVAVSGFFVLSGMVLVYNYAHLAMNPAAIKQFFQARFARLYPMYLFSILFALPLYFWYQRQTNEAYLHVVPVVTLVTLVGIQSWYRGWVDQLNPPSWSLSVEAFFYALFPFINRFFQNLRPKHILFLLLVLTSFNVFFIGSIIDASQQLTPTFSWIHPSVFPLFHLNTFIIGMCFGYLGFVHKRLHYPGAWSHLALPVLLVMIFCMNLPQLGFIDINSGGYAFLFGVFFLMLANASTGLAKLFSLKWIVLLGESSYALYLIHLPLRTYMIWLVNKLNLPFADYPNSFLFLYAIIAVLLSVVCFLYLERPLTRRLRSLFSNVANSTTAPLQPATM